MGKKRTFKGIWILLILLIVAGGGLYVLNHFYKKIYSPSVQLKKPKTYFHIPTGADFNAVRDSLYAKDILKDTGSFAMLARWMNLPNHIYPGKYELKDGMNNKELVELLRSGQDEPVHLTIHQFEFIEGIAGHVGERLETDSMGLLKLMRDTALIRDYGFDTANFLCMFIPNTYQFHWNTSAKEFLDRMHREYRKFWNESRREKARKLGMSPCEVQILASIVQKESTKRAEWDTIAGVYINRLEKGIRLQADPTLKYILHRRGQKNVNRIYNKHKELKSPYNTYKYAGLPPGPLLTPEIPVIQAVLDPAKHEYLYFVAKPGYSGFHNFSKTLRQHNNYARKYQRFLDRENIH